VRVNVESSTERGPKFVRLGRELGVSWHEARSRCISVWFVCYDQRSEHVPAIEVDIAADLDGFGAAMCRVGLAEATKRDAKVLRIDGVKERIKFLIKQSEKGKAGGTNSGKARRSRADTGEANASGAAEANASGHPQASREAYSLALSPALSPDLDQAPDRKKLQPAAAPPVLELVGVEPRTRATDPKPPAGDHATFIADFDAMYAEHNDGARPTWGGKPGKLVSTLLKAHGLAECLRRSANMFRAPPPFPPPPHDMATLAQHFDKFAKPHQRNGGHYQHTGAEKYADGEIDL
jgi:hypothetical protein